MRACITTRVELPICMVQHAEHQPLPPVSPVRKDLASSLLIADVRQSSNLSTA